MHNKYTEESQYDEHNKSIDAENNKIEHTLYAEYMVFLLFGK
jgi:hypothetical protein